MTINRNLSKSILSFVFVIIILIGMTIMAGCSSKDTIVGTWAYVNNNGEITDSKMYFNEDGTCSNIPWEGSTGADAVSYKIQDDGKLIFTMEWDGNMSLEAAKTEEEALKSYDYYYLSGDILIFRKYTYKKV